MKIILGDNQFFGINHFDLEKGASIKMKFDSIEKISAFIKDALNAGMDGFMINSNDEGYKIISTKRFPSTKEIHYSIPYAHKYANIVNEEGMMSLLSHVMRNTSMISNLKSGIRLVTSRNLKNLVPLAVDLEVPKQLPKGSHVYLQNIITDLVIGLGRFDLLKEFIESVKRNGYKPGIVTLNPIKLQKALESEGVDMQDLIICFNVNDVGFNVFPNKEEVEKFARAKHPFKKMGMSVFASGAGNIPKSIEYLKLLNLDYVVFGTSRIKNVKANLLGLKS
jgi:hypothetical protein